MPLLPVRPAVAASLFLVALTACGAAGRGGEFPQGLAGHTGSPVAVRAWTPWPQALYDAQHSGAADVVGPRTGHVRWTRTLEGNVTPGPVVGSDGTIYAASNAGVLHAIDPSTGADRWTVDEHAPYGSDLSSSPAVLPSGLILWPGPRGNLVAVTADGVVGWRLDLGAQATSPAVLANGDVAVGTTSGTVAVLHPTVSGPGRRWSISLGAQSYGSVAWSSDGRTVYESLLSGVVALRDGSEVWRRTLGETVEVSPAVAPDGTVVIGTNGQHEFGLRPADGSVAWSYTRPITTYSSPVVTADGIAYFGDHANRVVGVDASSGARQFGYEGPGGTKGQIWTSIAVDKDHTVFAGTHDGHIYAVDRTGRRLWSFTTGANVDSYPALTGDGALVIGVTDGRLISFADR